MRRVEFRAERVAELVAGELFFAAELREVAVRDAAGPHDLAHGVIVRRVFDGDAGAGDDVFEQRFRDEVGEAVLLLDVGQIALERVHEDVADAGDELLLRHGVREFGV